MATGTISKSVPIKRIIKNLSFYNKAVCSANGYIDDSISISLTSSELSNAIAVAQDMSCCSASVESITTTRMTVRLFNLHAYDEMAGILKAKYSLFITG